MKRLEVVAVEDGVALTATYRVSEISFQSEDHTAEISHC